MNMLHDDLALFAQAIHGHEMLPDTLAVCPNYPVASALDIYRNNYRGNLQGALAAAYPVVEQIVGKDFFSLLAREYIKLHPSTSGNLHLYGAGLDGFVADFTPAQSLVYLPDVATLEWACHCAYYAADADTFDAAKLAQIPAERHSQLRLRKHPACHLVRSRYPIAAIWQAHQPGATHEFHIDLDRGPCNVLVNRVNDMVQIGELSAAAADWLQRLQQGSALGTASSGTLGRYPDFDLQAALLHLVSQGVLIDFDLLEFQETPP